MLLRTLSQSFNCTLSVRIWLQCYIFLFRGKSVERFEYVHEDWVEGHSQWCTKICNDHLIYLSISLPHLKVYFFFWFPTVFPQGFQPETNHCSCRVSPWRFIFVQNSGARWVEDWKLPIWNSQVSYWRQM